MDRHDTLRGFLLPTEPPRPGQGPFFVPALPRGTSVGHSGSTAEAMECRSLGSTCFYPGDHLLTGPQPGPPGDKNDPNQVDAYLAAADPPVHRLWVTVNLGPHHPSPTPVENRSSSMFDAFTKVVAQADARGEFINAGQIDALAAMVADSNKRMDTVNRITSNASKIVTNAARDLFEAQPALIAPGGNAYTHRRMAACLRDMDIILRYVTYAVFTGDASVLEDRCLNGLRETYLALGVPGASVAEGVRKMKDAAVAIANDRNGITPGDCSALMSEIGTYFDRAAAAVG